MSRIGSVALPRKEESATKTGITVAVDPDRFDAAWYLSAYPDVAASGVDPAEHYRTHGRSEGRSPCAAPVVVDRAWYLATYPDVAASGMDPLDHYRHHGRAEGRRPRALNSGDKAPVGPGQDSVAGGLARSDRGEMLDRRAGLPSFDAAWYLRTYPDVAASGLDPLRHYEAHGRAEGRSPNAAAAAALVSAEGSATATALRPPTPLPAWLEAAWYSLAHADVLASGLDAATHYRTRGHAEGLAPNSMLARLNVPVRPPLEPSQAELASHARMVDASGIFDRGWYRERYSVPLDLAATDYVRSGAFLGRDPSPFFSSLDYLRANPDVAAGGSNPLVHYIQHGFREGRKISPAGDPLTRVTARIWRRGF